MKKETLHKLERLSHALLHIDELLRTESTFGHDGFLSARLIKALEKEEENLSVLIQNIYDKAK